VVENHVAYTFDCVNLSQSLLHDTWYFNRIRHVKYKARDFAIDTILSWSVSIGKPG
jgi:hypothetical protein